MADHWRHWLTIGERLGARAPRMFRVNWFRKGDDGRYLWPGFGDDIRVLDWIVARLTEDVDAVQSPVGLLPFRHDLDLQDLALAGDDLRELLTVDAAGWRRECDAIESLFDRFDGRVPIELRGRLDRLRRSLDAYR